jgi:hypothetical protein
MQFLPLIRYDPTVQNCGIRSYSATYFSLRHSRNIHEYDIHPSVRHGQLSLIHLATNSHGLLATAPWHRINGLRSNLILNMFLFHMPHGHVII